MQLTNEEMLLVKDILDEAVVDWFETDIRMKTFYNRLIEELYDL